MMRLLALAVSLGAVQASAAPVQILAVNDIPGHYEVLAGLMSVLSAAFTPSKTPAQVEVLLVGNPKPQLCDTGLLNWLGAPPAACREQRTSVFSADTQVGKLRSFDLATLDQQWTQRRLHTLICVSPELDSTPCRALLTRLKPKLLLAFVHRADLAHSRLRHLASASPATEVIHVALAPHVAHLYSKVSRAPTVWMLPVASLPASVNKCSSKACLSGFVIQGTIRTMGSQLTRNYAGLWAQMLPVRNQSITGPMPSIKILGKGQTKWLGIPPALQSHVQHRGGLPYPEFWSAIHHSLALLPCFPGGSPSYLRSRLSSTVIASLVTSTPLLADEQLLACYSFLGPETVFLRRSGEDEVTAMRRVMQMPGEEVMARRRAVEKLSAKLNSASVQDLRRMTGLDT